MKKILLIFSIVLPLFVYSDPTTKGKEFWFAFMENLNLATNGNPTFYLYVSSDYNTSGIVKLQSGWTMSFSVTPNHVSELTLPPGIFYGQGDTARTNFGFKIETLDSCTVYVLHRRAYFSDATLVLPIEELGTEYSVMAHRDESQAGGLSEFVIAATEDSSTIEITPSAFSTSYIFPPGIPFQITLNKGQTYQLQSSNDLTGSILKCVNNKKFAVFGGITQGIVSVSNTSHMYEQVLPYSYWGTDFIFVPTDSMQYDKLKFLAKDAGTQIYTDSTLLVSLNAPNGVWTTNFSSTPTYIHSNKLITVSKLCKGGTGSMQGYMGDPNLVSLLPLQFVQTKVKVQLRAISSIQSNFFNIVTPTAEISNLRLDSILVDTTMFHPVPYLPCYSYAQFRIDTLFHVLESSTGFNTTIETFEWLDAYTFSGGYSKIVALDNSICDKGIHEGINDPGGEKNKLNISISPNPSHGIVTIRISSNEIKGDLHFILYNDIGEEIESRKIISCFDGCEFNINSLRSGIYFYSLQKSNFLIKSGKFIVGK